jgi:carbon storage regulator
VPSALTLQEAPALPTAGAPAERAGAPAVEAFAFTQGTCLSCRGDKEGGRSMLVLTRKSNQSIMIGDDIEITVLSIMGEKVRIGIQAPRDIPVFRKEVYLEIQQERDGAEAVPAAGARGEVDAALRKLQTGD